MENLTHKQEVELERIVMEFYPNLKMKYKKELFESFGIDCAFNFKCYILDCMNIER